MEAYKKPAKIEDLNILESRLHKMINEYLGNLSTIRSKVCKLEFNEKSLSVQVFNIRKLLNLKKVVSKCHECDSKINYLNSQLILLQNKFGTQINANPEWDNLNIASVYSRSAQLNSQNHEYKINKNGYNYIRTIRINMKELDENIKNEYKNVLDSLSSWPHKIVLDKYVKFYGLDKEWFNKNSDFLEKCKIWIVKDKRIINKSLENRMSRNFMQNYIKEDFLWPRQGRKPKLRFGDN